MFLLLIIRTQKVAFISWTQVSEAAYAAGFSDVGYFRNCFKGEYGMTPSDYMKQQKSSTSVKYNMGENDE